MNMKKKQQYKRLPKYLAYQKVSMMLDKAKKDNRRNYLVLLIFWRTGIRIGELIRLRKKDISLDEEQITVRKGGRSVKKDRVIPLESGLGALLGFYIDNLRPNDTLFGLSKRAVRNIVYKYRSDNSDTHPHTLRHSFAVYCLKNNMNIRTLQKILGHGDLNTTAIYLDVIGADIKEDFQKIKW